MTETDKAASLVCKACGRSLNQCDAILRQTGVGCCDACWRDDSHGLGDPYPPRSGSRWNDQHGLPVEVIRVADRSVLVAYDSGQLSSVHIDTFPQRFTERSGLVNTDGPA